MTLRLRRTLPKARTLTYPVRRPRVRVGAPDPSLTTVSGLAALDTLADRLDIVGALDAAVGPVKDRDRGLTAGQVLVGVAFGQLAGASFWSGADRMRADPGATPKALLTVTEIPASTTAAGLARRFTPDYVAGIESGLATVYRRWMALLPAQRRHDLAGAAPTIDLDTTDVQTYGRTKQGMAWS